MKGLLSVGLTFCSVHAAQLPSLPDVGARFVPPPGAERGLCMVSPGQMDPCVRVEVNGIKYTVAFRSRRGLGELVTYIATNDPEFVGPGGLRVGDLLERGPEELRRLLGFEVLADGGEPDGWRPVVGFNGEVAYGDVKKESVVIRGFSMNESPRSARRNPENRCECQRPEPGREHFRGWMEQKRQRATGPAGELRGRAVAGEYSMSGAFVEILRNRKRVAACVADRDGKFCVPRMRPGHYLMVVSNPGFERQEVDLELKREHRPPVLVPMAAAH